MFLQAFLALSSAATPARAEGGYIALQAGTIQLVEQGQVIEGGCTILVLDGKIVAAGMGMELPQLPKTIMGAVVALRELFDIARGGPDDGSYGPALSSTLGGLLREHKPWRMGANEAAEVRALLAFFKEAGEPLVIDGG